MKPKFTIHFIVFCIALIVSSCDFFEPAVVGNGNVVEEIRKVASFDEISVSRGLEVHIKQGPVLQVKVIADENLLDIIETKADDSNLKITTTKNIGKSKSKKIVVTAPKLSVIKSFAGSRVYSEEVLRSKNLEVSATAGSLVKLNIDVAKLKVNASAGSHIKLEGSSKIFVAKANSGSNIKGEDLSASDCESKVNSGANIWIHSNNRIKAHASSGGNIFYYGNPRVVESSKSSGGNIIKK